MLGGPDADHSIRMYPARSETPLALREKMNVLHSSESDLETAKYQLNMKLLAEAVEANYGRFGGRLELVDRMAILPDLGSGLLCGF